MALAGLIDPTKTGNYPVILGDSLMGKPPNEVFTSIRYNHQPALSSPSAPSSARLKPSVPGKTTSYDLTYADGDNKYAFSGPRNTSDNQYVLYFDPSRESFVLDKVDSTFNMNVTRLPDNSDSESLRHQYPQIDGTPRPAPKASKPASKSANKSAGGSTSTEKPAPKPRAKAPAQKKEVKRKPAPKQPPKSMALSLPVPEPAKPESQSQTKRRPQDEDEDEDDDDDGGLLIEYPDEPPAAHQTNFSPAFPPIRRFDDFMNRRESEGDDADGESADDGDFTLLSPVNNNEQQMAHGPMDVDGDEGDGGADLDDDLEKDLEDALEEAFIEGSPDGDESDISEEE
ncbi:hypothetical protein QQZ08_006728 [Neonectria magnoliae]|uniref:Transcription elongation factor Eaf N-terminal domain-containing protein n=1 Tax=Neonectria magnoliae TaxID=2732573 RepID=A0ABR1I1J8_9HYPO